MIGRNDPCPCGSGKKHKKCCLIKSEISIEKLVEDELQRIVHSLYEQPQSHSDIAEYDKYNRQWRERLGKLWDDDSIESSVSEYFFFVARRDLWNRHLVKVLNTPIRSTVRSVIENWQSPITLFAKVKNEEDGFVEVEEILGNKTFFLKKEEGMPADKDSIVFGVVLPDNRIHEDGVFVMTSLMFVKDGNDKFENKVVTLAESSGIENSMEFYKEYMAEIYRVMLREETLSTEDLIENELTPIQQEAIDVLNTKLTTIGLNEEANELLTNITVTYFLKEQPNFRKPNVIAAGVFLVAIELGMLGEYSMTNIEIAKLFDVSTSSMTKHRDAIYEFVLEMMDLMSDQEQEELVISTNVGTDPRITERVNWEMFVKMSRENFETFEEMKEYLDATMNEKFHPADPKEQAQIFVYDAYDAKDDEERYNIAKKAADLDPENIDVILLKAEIAEVNQEAEKLYSTAIKFGEKQFEKVEENPWGLVTNRPYMRALFAYGVWLYEQERYSDAGKVFTNLLKLNPDDNQGARYLAIASFTHAEQFEKALEVLDQYYEGSDSDAVYLFLDWYTEASMTEGESEDSGWMFEEANVANPFVKGIMDNDLPRQPYPRSLDLASGSAEEAMYIWILLK